MKCSQIQPVGPGQQVERNIKIIALTKVHLKKKKNKTLMGTKSVIFSEQSRVYLRILC